MSRFLYLLPVILATACYLATDESWARSASHSCFFHDGKTLCGEEAELARNEVAEDLKRTMVYFSHNFTGQNLIHKSNTKLTKKITNKSAKLQKIFGQNLTMFSFQCLARTTAQSGSRRTSTRR